jgi:hypothetical protein
MYVSRNIEARSCNHCCSGRAISITCTEGVFVAVGIQHAMCMRHIVVWVLPGCAYLSSLSHKRHDFRKRDIVHKMCVLILYATLV